MRKSVFRAVAVCLSVFLPLSAGAATRADDDDDGDGGGGPAALPSNNAGPSDPDDPVVIYSDKPSVTVQYDIIGSAPSADISFTADATLNNLVGNPVPWHKEAVIWPPVQFVSLFATVSGVDGWVIQPNGYARTKGSPGTTGGSVTCRISMDGKVIMQRTATGAYHRARCAMTVRFFV